MIFLRSLDPHATAIEGEKDRHPLRSCDFSYCTNGASSNFSINDFVKENKSHSSWGPTRLFIHDRTIAFLDRITPVPRSLTLYEDKYMAYGPEPYFEGTVNTLKTFSVDKSNPKHAFSFDFSLIAKNYDVREVFIQDLADFLDYEHQKLAFDVCNRYNPFDVPKQPIIGDRIVSGKRTKTSSFVDSCISMGQSSNTSSTISRASRPAYSFNPCHYDVVLDQPNSFADETLEYLRELSGGRLERLAEVLRNFSPLHMIFKDYGLWRFRPTILIFWFLSMLHRRPTRLTFDNILAERAIFLHEVLNLGDVEEVTVHYPMSITSHKCGELSAFLVTSHLFIKWLNLPVGSRKPITFNMLHCPLIEAKAMARFIKAWRSTPDIREFDQIVLECSYFVLEELLYELECEGNSAHPEYTLYASRSPRPRRPCTVLQEDLDDELDQHYAFLHRSGKSCIHYYFDSPRVVFRYLRYNVPSLDDMRRASAYRYWTPRYRGDTRPEPKCVVIPDPYVPPNIITRLRRFLKRQ